MISVVITCYNKELYIEECINSIINQTYNNLEIIIINDKSTDNSLNIINSFNDKRIKLINNENNMGAGKSRKLGIASCTGEYIILIDADDYISKGYIELLYKHAKKYDSDIVSGNIIYKHKNNTHNNIINEYITIDEKIKFKNTESLSFINNKLISKKLWDKVPYSESPFIEDAPTYCKLIYHANKIIDIESINNEYYFYREDINGLCKTASNFKFIVYQILFIYDVYEYFKKLNDLQFFYKLYNVNRLLRFIANFDKYKDKYKEDTLKYNNDFNIASELVKILYNEFNIYKNSI